MQRIQAHACLLPVYITKKSDNIEIAVVQMLHLWYNPWYIWKTNCMNKWQILAHKLCFRIITICFLKALNSEELLSSQATQRLYIHLFVSSFLEGDGGRGKRKGKGIYNMDSLAKTTFMASLQTSHWQVCDKTCYIQAPSTNYSLESILTFQRRHFTSDLSPLCIKVNQVIQTRHQFHKACRLFLLTE